MRRADRLFQIIQILRRKPFPVTAAAIAAEVEVSPRSIYRDIADLMAQRVPIRGEAGLGYILERGYDMPPLMLTVDEIEAAVLGAQWVASKGDPALARAAKDLVAKIAAAVPDRLLPVVAAPSVGAAPPVGHRPAGMDLAPVRHAIREGYKMRIAYRDEAGRESERTIWPIVIGYAETVRLLAAWCELRQSFRHFRVDRILRAEFPSERHGSRPGELRHRWRRHFEAERGFSPE